MTYEITFKKSALKDLLNFPADDVKNIIIKIDQLAIEPRPNGCKKLRGSNEGLWRISVGNYRVIYTIEDVIKVVEINAVAHRKDIY